MSETAFVYLDSGQAVENAETMTDEEIIRLVASSLAEQMMEDPTHLVWLVERE